jgi:cell division cycle 14
MLLHYPKANSSICRYEKFERVDQGDLNWISPDFIAFASPIFPAPPPPKRQADGTMGPKLTYTEEFLAKFKPPGGTGYPTNLQELSECKMTEAFRNVLEHFYVRDVGLVVRLNEHLYPAKYFTALGITHMDMIFDDGTCPPLPDLRAWINLAHEVITVHKKKVAVHCKAGLGRTGCLIGAYLIYRYGFTAEECIAYMRFMRPGMLVGPQQHWLHLNQDIFRQWAFEDRFAEERENLLAQIQHLQSNLQPTLPQRKNRISSNTSHHNMTPPPRRSILGEIGMNDVSPEHLPAPTPGQPRKNSAKFFSPNRQSQQQQENFSEYVDGIRVDTDDENNSALEAEDMSEEELHLRITAKRLSSRSPKSDKRRSISYNVAAAAASATIKETRLSGDRTPPHMIGKTGNGVTTSKVRNNPRRTGAINVTKEGRVRKASGRTPSYGTYPVSPVKAD